MNSYLQKCITNEYQSASPQAPDIAVGLMTSGLAAFFGFTGVFHPVAGTVSSILAFIAMIAWCRYIFLVAHWANEIKQRQQKASPGKSAWVAFLCANGCMLMNLAMFVVALPLLICFLVCWGSRSGPAPAWASGFLFFGSLPTLALECLLVLFCCRRIYRASRNLLLELAESIAPAAVEDRRKTLLSKRLAAAMLLPIVAQLTCISLFLANPFVATALSNLYWLVAPIQYALTFTLVNNCLQYLLQNYPPERLGAKAAS